MTWINVEKEKIGKNLKWILLYFFFIVFFMIYNFCLWFIYVYTCVYERLIERGIVNLLMCEKKFNCLWIWKLEKEIFNCGLFNFSFL